MDKGGLGPESVYGLASQSSSNLGDSFYDTRIGTSKVVNPKNNWKKNNFARVSRKLDQVKSISRRSAGGVSRAEAFRFEAVERADAFKEVDYEAPEYYGPEDSLDYEPDTLSSISELPPDVVTPLKLKTSINENILMSLGINPEEIAELKSQIPSGHLESSSGDLQGIDTNSSTAGGMADASAGIAQTGGTGSALGINLQITGNGSEAQPGSLGGFGGSTNGQPVTMMKGPAVTGVDVAQASVGGIGGAQVQVVESVPVRSGVEHPPEADQKAGIAGVGGSSATVAGFGQAPTMASGTSGSDKKGEESGSNALDSTVSKPTGAGADLPMALNVDGGAPKGIHL